MKKTLNIILNVVIVLFVIFSVVVTVFAFSATFSNTQLPTIGGKVILTVQSESMSPTFKAGDIIIGTVLTDEEAKALQVGDVITFKADLDGDGTKEFNTHRITNVDNSEKQMKLTEDSDSHKRYVCRNTRDKVFLLSMKEINNPELGFVNDSSRIRPATDYAYDNMAFRSGLAEKGGIWWLRSPVYNYASRAYLVLYTGEADNKTNRTRDPTTGIVPALWVPLKAIKAVE